MNFFKKLLQKIRYPKKTIDAKDLHVTDSSFSITLNSASSPSFGTIGNNSNYISTVTCPSTNNVIITSDIGHLCVSLDDLIQYGRRGYLVKIMNLSIEDRKWLRDQLDTDSVDIA